MRCQVLFGLLSSLVVMSCSKDKFKTQQISNRSDAFTTVDFALNPKTMNLAIVEKAYVKSVDVLCDNKTTVLSYDLTPETQTLTLARSLQGCEYILKSFYIGGLENRPVQNPIYQYAQATGSTNDGTIYSVFDLKNDRGELLDRKLVTSSLKEETSSTCPDNTCLVAKTTVNFSYSEIQRSDVILENNIKIQELSFQVSQELAPQCEVKASFLHPAGQNPFLQLSVTNCTGLMDHKNIVLGVGHHRYSNSYQVRKTAQDPVNFVGLHDLIDSYNLNVNMTSGNLTLVLSLEQMMQITGKVSWIGALREDFVLAIRNKSGKSIRYYVIDNTCSSDIVDRFQDVVARTGKGSWMLSSPGAGNQSYYQIRDFIFDTTKPAVDIPGFCIDTDRSNELDFKYEGQIFLSYDIDRLYRERIVERPAAMPAVNWLINKYFGKGIYTYGEMQKAIWHLLDDQVISNGLGPVNDQNVFNMVQEARTNGSSYVPTMAGEYVAIVMVPDMRGVLVNQAVIGIVKIPSDICVTNAAVCK